MARYQPRTEPAHDNKGWPTGIPYIIGNEGCERFSYYGMKAILFVYITGLYMNMQDLDLNTARKTQDGTITLVVDRDGQSQAITFLPRGPAVEAYGWERDPATPESACRF